MHYAGRPQSDSAANAPTRVDMRSDTVTRPTEGMRAAMAAADVGDDVYGDDPSVNALQEKAAKLLGKEAALFVSSGTQSNLCAMLAHCQRGEEILTGHDYHVFIDEAGGASVLGGIMFAPIQTAADGGLDPDAISRTVKPDDEHCAVSRLLTLENSWHGQAISLDRINAAARRGREHGLIVHMDGARLMNACVKLGVSPADMLAEIDSVSLCLSKGLGAPAGSGGICWQGATYRGTPGEICGGDNNWGATDVEVWYPRADDHANALRLADGLQTIPQLDVSPDEVQTNMVFVGVPEGSSVPLQAHLLERGIMINRSEPTIRLVTHLDSGADEVDLFVEEMKSFFA